MTDLSAQIARDAAQTLTSCFGTQLPLDVEKEIQRPVESRRPEHYIGVAESIALAALIVQCAQLGWQIYQDMRDKEAVRRRLRLQIRLPVKITSVQRDQVIEAVIDQMPEP